MQFFNAKENAPSAASRRFKHTETAGTSLTSVEKSVQTSRRLEQTNKQTNRPVDKSFSCSLDASWRPGKGDTVNDANLRSGGSVPEWEGHLIVGYEASREG